MTNHHRTKVTIAGLLLLSSAGAPSAPASAAVATSSEQHCVVEVVSERDGNLITGPEECYQSYADAKDAANNKRQDGDGSLSAESSDLTSSDSTIGVHFTGTAYSGSSITIVGSICSGGVWRPTGTWDNNIASSYHYCGSSPTRFYDSALCSGIPNYAIYSANSTLYTMNDRASCVRYG